jgi:hypothetical protein
MPVIHTTSAYAAKQIIKGDLIRPRPCDTFKGEELTYLFYGRPSYKKIGDSQIAQYWELPSLFVMDYDAIDLKRIYPFDTGAFGKFPNFISMMPLEEFELAASLGAPQRLVSAFFVDPDRYFRLRPRDARDFNGRFDVTATDEEIRALHQLALSYSERIDDRRFAIEIQTECEIKLRDSGLKAVIIPEEYCESDELVKLIESHGADIIPYPTHSLKQEMYYHTIYNILFELYREMGLVR